MTRDEHLAWAKQRALEYLDRGDMDNAVISMLSDLSKHEELKGIADKMGLFGLMLLLQSRNPRDIRRFVEGFN